MSSVISLYQADLVISKGIFLNYTTSFKFLKVLFYNKLIFSIKAATQDITEVGARVFDLLGKEEELRVHRDKAT